jgi:hypothetical protein
LEISNKFPNICKQAEELAGIPSLTSPFYEHAHANFL